MGACYGYLVAFFFFFLQSVVEAQVWEEKIRSESGWQATVMFDRQRLGMGYVAVCLLDTLVTVPNKAGCHSLQGQGHPFINQTWPLHGLRIHTADMVSDLSKLPLRAWFSASIVVATKASGR